MTVDGYWLRMGNMAVDTLIESNVMSPSHSSAENVALAEYFGGLFEQAHDMGLRLGEAKGRYLVAMRASCKDTPHDHQR